ncbi:MAG: SAP domain-containing protein [Acidobacteriaceae bacterium]
MSEAQSVPANWASSQPHLALLEKFLSAREVKSSFLEFWAPAFDMNPQRVIDGLIAHRALELAPTVADLKTMLSSRGVKVSGKKAELIQRLLEADPKGMEALYAHRMILRCTPAASQAVAEWKIECMKAFETASDNVIAALRNRLFKEAIRTADAYRKSKFEPPVHPAQEAMTIKLTPHSIEERANDLAAVFTMRPKILKGLHPEQWGGLYLNYAVWQLLGRVAPEKCMPGFADLGAMSSETATRMLSFYVKDQRDLARWRELGIKRVTIFGVGGCEACVALYDKTFRLDKLPELPYEGCTCELGCRCLARPDMGI